MKKLLLILALLLLPSAALAQCNGNFGANTACGSIAGGAPGPIAWSSIVGNSITALTGDGTATGPGSVPLTLATVNSNVGSFGSATQCVVITVNAKGLITAASASTCTPAIGSVTGLGSGVLTALGLAVDASGGLIGPTPVRAGDIIYWNGSTWVTLSGNNSGTTYLSETSAGVPSWVVAPGSGTVTSATVTASTGLSPSGTCTSTTVLNCTLAVSLTIATNSLGSDVTMTTASTYYDGPSMAQGTSGTWAVSGTITYTNATGSSVSCKLWDGTTVIDSAISNIAASNAFITITLSGNLSSPAGNIKISCTASANNGAMKFNASGNSKDSTVSGHRIQ